MDVQTNSIRNIVLDVLHSKFAVPISTLGADSWNMPLTGMPFAMNAVRMVYLFFELEKVFCVRISEHYLDNYGLITINKFVDAVIKCNPCVALGRFD